MAFSKSRAAGSAANPKQEKARPQWPGFFVFPAPQLVG